MNDHIRQRLDVVLVARGLAETRSRARDLVLRGAVSVGGEVAARPAQLVGSNDAIVLAPGAADYVSRSALKLKEAMVHFKFAATGLVALDVGASTGGFTQVLLEAGAARVYAVENGVGQLHPKLTSDSRVISLERTDARRLGRQMIPEHVAAIVADVSFISLTKVLPAVVALAQTGCWLVVLVKPQFEAEPGDVPRDGIVKDEEARARAVCKVWRWIAEQPGWRCLGAIPSPLHGGDGNLEFLLAAVHDAP